MEIRNIRNLGRLGNFEDMGDDGNYDGMYDNDNQNSNLQSDISSWLNILGVGLNVANQAVDLSENWNTGQANNNQLTQEQLLAQQRALAQQRSNNNLFANRGTQTTQNNTMLYVGIGVSVLAVGGLVWWALSSK